MVITIINPKRCNMRKKLTYYPMTRDLCAIARYAHLLNGYEINALLVPPHTGYEGKDINIIDGGDETNLQLSLYDDRKLHDCDVLLMDYNPNLKSKEMYNHAIKYATDIGKEVICSQKLINHLEGKIIQIPTHQPIALNFESDRLYGVNIPVITVLTQGAETDQFVIELALRNHFINNGYKVSQIGSFEGSQFFGFASLPNFLYEARDAYEKTLMFNDHVAKMVTQENPNILIMGVPDSIMKYNNQILNGMGYIPSIINNAVNSDIAMLSMYCGNYKLRYFEEMEKYGKYCYNTPIEYFNISNALYTPEMIDEYPNIKYVEVNTPYALDAIKKVNASNYNLFNALNKESMDLTCKNINDALADNIRIF